MKRRFAPALLLLAALAHGQDTPAPTYKVGEADRYAVRLVVSTSFGDIVQKSTMTKTVVKVYDDGSADVETSFDGAVGGVEGAESPLPPSATTPSVARIDRLGREIQGAAAGGLSLDPSGFARLGIPDMTDAVVGKEFPLDDATTHGKATILGLDAKTIKVGTDFALRDDTMAQEMRVKVATTFDLITNRIVVSEGELRGGLPDEGDVKIESVKFTLTRL